MATPNGYREFAAEVGKRARQIRDQVGLSQTELRNTFGVDISLTQRVEQGSHVGMRGLFTLASAYGLEDMTPFFAGIILPRRHKTPRQKKKAPRRSEGSGEAELACES
jgi:transcriptional regulator with XRE-family HTH domain